MSVRSRFAAAASGAFVAIVLATPGQAQTTAELALRIERLEGQIRDMTGLIDALTYQVEQLQAIVNELAANGMAALPPAAAETPAATPPAATPPVAETPATTQTPPTLGAPPTNLGMIPATPQTPGGPLDLTQALNPAGGFNLDNGAAPPAEETIAPPAAIGNPPEAAAPTVAMTGNEQADYDAAYQYVLNGDYALAEEAFNAFLRSYPGGALAVDALFWRAESMFSRGMYREAANEFYDVFIDHSDHPRAPDMLLKLGISLAQLGQTESACDIFVQVSVRYPNASNAILQRVATEQANAGC